MRKQIPTKHTNLDLTNIDHVLSSGTHSGCSAMLYVFEDKDAVIEMVFNCRSPTMRHVLRTHRVALDWLFGGVDLSVEETSAKGKRDRDLDSVQTLSGKAKCACLRRAES